MDRRRETHAENHTNTRGGTERNPIKYFRIYFPDCSCVLVYVNVNTIVELVAGASARSLCGRSTFSCVYWKNVVVCVCTRRTWRCIINNLN